MYFIGIVCADGLVPCNVRPSAEKNVGSRTIFLYCMCFPQMSTFNDTWTLCVLMGWCLALSGHQQKQCWFSECLLYCTCFLQCPLLMTRSHEIPQMRATGAYWWEVNTGSGDGLVPTGSNPIPKPTLTQFCIAIRDHYAAVSLTIKAWWGTYRLMHCVIVDLNIILTEIDIIFRQFPQQYILHPYWPWG